MRNAARKILPPYIGMILLAVGYGLHFSLMPEPWLSTALRWLGFVPALGGIVLIRVARAEFVKKSNPVRPGETPVALITDGPYRWTRNPMYLGITLFLGGIALGVATWPMLIAPIVFPVAVGWAFIPMEEALLDRIFGESYQAYRSRVRRWF